MKNKIIDEPIKSVAGRSGGQQEVSHTHPSFGLISVTRATHRSKVELFGAEIEHGSTINIEVRQAEVGQSLGRNWYHARETISSVEMSSIQYAEMISNPNSGSGVPCTIRKTQTADRIVSRHIDSTTTYVQSAIERKVSDLQRKAKTIVADVTEILGKKSILKSDREAIKNLIGRLSQEMSSNLPYYEECALESIDKAKLEAKAEIEGYVSHAISRAGIKSLNSLAELEYRDNPRDKPLTEKELQNAVAVQTPIIDCK